MYRYNNSTQADINAYVFKTWKFLYAENDVDDAADKYVDASVITTARLFFFEKQRS